MKNKLETLKNKVVNSFWINPKKNNQRIIKRQYKNLFFYK